MRRNKGLIIALFSSIFFVKIALCLATLYFQCNNQKLMNSLIMQVEIEHEDSSQEDVKEQFAKDIKYLVFDNHSENIHVAQNISHDPNIIFANLYPLNAEYTKIVAPPPDKA